MSLQYLVAYLIYQNSQLATEQRFWNFRHIETRRLDTTLIIAYNSKTLEKELKNIVVQNNPKNLRNWRTLSLAKNQLLIGLKVIQICTGLPLNNLLTHVTEYLTNRILRKIESENFFHDCELFILIKCTFS